MAKTIAAAQRGARPGRGAAHVPLLVTVDRRARAPLQRQVYASIRDAILSGRLAAGVRLPSSRALATELGVARTTVVLAYESLATEGYISGRGSAGSFVTRLEIVQRTRPSPRAPRKPRGPDGLRGLGPVRAAPVPFRVGEPALDLFPARLWARLYARRARQAGRAMFGYGSGTGHGPLRAAIAAYVGASRGVNTTAEQVVLTRGTQQGLSLAARVLLAEGEPAWVEDPGYLAARAALAARGTLIPVPVDGEGLVVSEGIRLGASARLACVAPSHQYPMGATMSLPRRLALLEWARASGSWILEDDYDSEFSHSGAPIPSLQGLDTHERVVYLGTFSKTMFPALRIGYLIAPMALVDSFLAAQREGDHMAAGLEQVALTEFIERGHYSRHVRQMRAVYADRQRALLRGLAREVGDLVDATPSATGMHLLAWLRDTSLDDAAVSRAARRMGVEAPPLSLYCVKVRMPPALLLGFAAIRTAEVMAGVKVLRRAILEVSGG